MKLGAKFRGCAAIRDLQSDAAKDGFARLRSSRRFPSVASLHCSLDPQDYTASRRGRDCWRAVHVQMVSHADGFTLTRIDITKTIAGRLLGSKKVNPSLDFGGSQGDQEALVCVCNLSCISCGARLGCNIRRPNLDATEQRPSSIRGRHAVAHRRPRACA
jgi:hypothetical protein